MDGKPDTATVIDAKSGDVAGKINLRGGSSPEFAVADGKGTVFVNFQDKHEVAAIDSNTLRSNRAGTRPESLLAVRTIRDSAWGVLFMTGLSSLC